ncbi:hypothetical protein CR513_38372, partial [Mucuna pruriens]
MTSHSSSIAEEADFTNRTEVLDPSDSENHVDNPNNLMNIFGFFDLLDQICRHNAEPECSISARIQVAERPTLLRMATTDVEYDSESKGRQLSKAETASTHQTLNPYKAEANREQNQLGTPGADSRSSWSTPTKIHHRRTSTSITTRPQIKTFARSLKHSPAIIADNLHREQEEKLLKVLQQHKKAIGWKLSDLLGINPSICTHRILMEEEACPIRQQQRRLNPTILDVVKKEVTKLLAAGIIYPISDSN